MRALFILVNSKLIFLKYHNFQVHQCWAAAVLVDKKKFRYSFSLVGFLFINVYGVFSICIHLKYIQIASRLHILGVDRDK